MKRPSITTDQILFSLLGIISLAAMALSFAALADLARENDMPFPMLLPVIVDSAALGFSVAAYRASVANRSEWRYSALVAAFTLLSAFLNVAHVWRGDATEHVLRYGLHALPPVVAYLILEVLLHEVRHGNATVRPPTAAQSVPTPQASRRGRKRGSTAPTGPDGQPTTHQQIARQQGTALRTYWRNRARSAA